MTQTKHTAGIKQSIKVLVSPWRLLAQTLLCLFLCNASALDAGAVKIDGAPDASTKSVDQTSTGASSKLTNKVTGFKPRQKNIKDAIQINGYQTDNHALTVVQERVGNKFYLYAKAPKMLVETFKISFKVQNGAVTPNDPNWHLLPQDLSQPIAVVAATNPKEPPYFQYNCEWHFGRADGKPDLKYVYQLPFSKDVKARVTQGYFGDSHKKGSIEEYAIDFYLPEGSIVKAARDGQVIAFKDDSNTGGKDPKFGNGANFVIIEHADKSYGEYLHLQKDGDLVRLGQRVKAGEMIGLSGNTGYSSGPHLHFCVLYYDKQNIRHSVPILFSTAGGVRPALKEGDMVSAPVLPPATTLR